MAAASLAPGQGGPGSVLAQQLSNRYQEGAWPYTRVVRRGDNRPNLGVLGSAGECGSKGIEIGNASCELAAFVPLVRRRQAVDAAGPLHTVKLGGIFEIGSPAHFSFFSRPALVAYVRVTCALIDGCQDLA